MTDRCMNLFNKGQAFWRRNESREFVNFGCLTWRIGMAQWLMMVVLEDSENDWVVD